MKLLAGLQVGPRRGRGRKRVFEHRMSFRCMKFLLHSTVLSYLVCTLKHTVLLHAVFTAQSFAAHSCFCRQLCCESTRLNTALQRFTARSLVHTFLMHTGLMHSILLCYSNTRLLYSYITTVTTLELHYYTTAALLPRCYTTARCYCTGLATALLLYIYNAS